MIYDGESHGAETRADTQIMRSVSSTIARTAEEARRSFDLDHGRLEDAIGGWAGTSKDVFAGLVDRWRSAADTMVTAVADHAEGIETAARRYDAEDRSNGDAIRASGTAGPDVPLRLDQ